MSFESNWAGLTRRQFLGIAGLAGGCAAGLGIAPGLAAALPGATDILPEGKAPAPVALGHFADRFHAFVWRNWGLVPVERLAAVSGATPEQVAATGAALGLGAPRRPTTDQQRRSFITVIKRNWHLLPYDQLLALLGWTPAQLAFTLREDDFLYIKLGSLKPRCQPLRYQPPDSDARRRAEWTARVLREELPGGMNPAGEPLFGFLNEWSGPAGPAVAAPQFAKGPSPRFCYSYFALYGDPLLEPDLSPYPDSYLDRLVESGVDGVWMQGVLKTLAPFPWDLKASQRSEERLANLQSLAERARRRGVGIWMYLNEPRAMPVAFFEKHPELKGVTEGDHATLCTSTPEVRDYIRNAVAAVARAVPALAGFFTITASENLTHCWSHHGGANCPRCRQRPPGEVVAEASGLIGEGLRAAGSSARLIAWDWGWADAWAEQAINHLPKDALLMSVSEWDMPLNRGGVKTRVGEYCISEAGPGDRARRHWGWARKRGLGTVAKIQAGNSWELSAVPYIPAVETVARHAAALRAENVGGLMLGWTLGGCPSPNLEVVAEVVSGGAAPAEAMRRVAERRFGAAAAPDVTAAWSACSRAFAEFPYHPGVVYQAPLQNGPSNLLYEKPTGYGSTMVGLPYDDLNGWRAVYPPDVFIAQLEKVASGFDRALEGLRAAAARRGPSGNAAERRNWDRELGVMEAAAIHFRSVANQSRFVEARQALAKAASPAETAARKAAIAEVLRQEIGLARRLHGLQTRDSRLGFEASNQYFYVPGDLAEKILNCRDLLERLEQKNG